MIVGLGCIMKLAKLVPPRKHTIVTKVAAAMVTVELRLC
jgi:hypothetical protein